MERNYRNELLTNVGCIYLPNDEWWKPERPLLRETDEDVWSFVESVIGTPEFEEKVSVMMHSAQMRGDCGPRDDDWADFMFEHLTHRATGDFFDQVQIYFDRHNLIEGGKARLALLTVFGKDAGRTMNRLREKMDHRCTKHAQERHLLRRCAYAWVWKVYAARAHRPEFSEQLVL